MSTRRGFLAGILAAGFAPAAIGSGVLMPVKKIALPAWPPEPLPEDIAAIIHRLTRQMLDNMPAEPLLRAGEWRVLSFSGGEIKVRAVQPYRSPAS